MSRAKLQVRNEKHRVPRGLRSFDRKIGGQKDEEKALSRGMAKRCWQKDEESNLTTGARRGGGGKAQPEFAGNANKRV
jgi:hypothetical protein